MRGLIIRFLDLALWAKISIILVPVLVIAIVVIVFFWQPSGLPSLTVSWTDQPVMLRIINGEVDIYSGQDRQFLGSGDETLLNAGDYIEAKENSVALLQYFDGSRVLVEGPAKVCQSWSRSVKGASLKDGRSICLEVTKGYVAVQAVEQSFSASCFEVCTPNSVGIVQGTIFEVNVKESAETTWETSKGAVMVGAITLDNKQNPKVAISTLNRGYLMAIPRIPDEWQSDQEFCDRLLGTTRAIISESLRKDKLGARVKGASPVMTNMEIGLAVYKINVQSIPAATPAASPVPHGYQLIQNQIFIQEAPGISVASTSVIIKPFFPFLPVPDIWKASMPEVVREAAPDYLFSIFDIDTPLGIAVDPGGQRLYVTQSQGNRNTIVFDTDGDQMMILSPPGTTSAGRNPSYVAVNWLGTVYISDRSRHAIDMYDCKSRYLGTFTPKDDPGISWSPLGLAFDSKGNLYVTDVTDMRHRIMVFNPSGELILEFGSSGKAEGQFYYPNDIAIDSSGRIYVADSNNLRVQVFTDEGQLLGQFTRSGEETLGFPRGIDIEENYLYVVDTFSHMVRVYNIETGVRPVFSFGRQGLGNGEFDLPNGIAVDLNGRLYIADRENDRIQVMGY
ncbi:hypothetical protein ACFLYQ_00205 [Chloroflexota bacterium]